MRYKITLQGNNHYFPEDFDDLLSGMLCEKLSVISELLFENFKYYNFSYFDFEEYDVLEDGSYYSKDAKVYFILSSIDDDFLRCVFSFLIIDEFEFNDDILQVIAIELLNNPVIDSDCTLFITHTPIQVNIINSNDLANYLSNLLVENYSIYFNVIATNLSVKIMVEECEEYDFERSHGYYDYDMKLRLKGNVELIKFAWDVGLGEFNYKGSGMLNVENDVEFDFPELLYES